jgi:ankyrin repeat protein
LKSPHHEAVISTLIEQGGGELINARNAQGCTPLHWVAGAGSAGMARFILNNQADPGIKDTDERSPLDRAKKTGDEALIQLLQRSAAS